MSDDFSTVMASIDPALVVVTTGAAGEQAGCLVGFHSQSSMSPGHYCLWLSKANHTFRTAQLASHFAVHFLTEEDLPVAEHFGTISGEDTDKFAGVEIASREHGVPLLAACPNRMVLERIAVLDDGGDHVCVTTKVLGTRSAGRFAPLRVSDASHLEPGHAAEERAIEP
jgi:flavin reductase (DIM6/NTAB) family NADH-FMN oxidoreductase RutF